MAEHRVCVVQWNTMHTYVFSTDMQSVAPVIQSAYLVTRQRIENKTSLTTSAIRARLQNGVIPIAWKWTGTHCIHIGSRARTHGTHIVHAEAWVQWAVVRTENGQQIHAVFVCTHQASVRSSAIATQYTRFPTCTKYPRNMHVNVRRKKAALEISF